jgi:hypothetical protein
MTAAFGSYILLLGGCLLAVAGLPVGRTKIGGSYWRGVRRLLGHWQWTTFLASILIGGLVMSIEMSFLFLYLERLGASKTLMGICLAVSTVSELPVWFGANWLIGRLGTRNVLFESADAAHPAQFYANSAPAHAAHPAHHVKAAAIKGDLLGAQESANHRVLTKYMHPAAFPTCQLVMGRTELQTGNVWNTLPPHTHDRRMEAYLYHNIPDGQAVFHFMGRPEATRHLVVRNNEAILSPPWSIHCGCGTSAYAFIWSMAGDNQTFTDMDAVPVPALF